MYVTKWKKSNWKAYILYEFHYKNSRWNIIPITYKVCPEGIQTCVTKNRDIYWRYMMQETLCTGQCHLSPLHSWHLGTSHSSPNHHPLPCPIPESHLWSEISSLSKVILVLGKARSHRVSNLCCRGLSHLGDMMFCQNTLHKLWCMGRCVLMRKLQITSCP